MQYKNFNSFVSNCISKKLLMFEIMLNHELLILKYEHFNKLWIIDKSLGVVSHFLLLGHNKVTSSKMKRKIIGVYAYAHSQLLKESFTESMTSNRNKWEL